MRRRKKKKEKMSAQDLLFMKILHFATTWKNKIRMRRMKQESLLKIVPQAMVLIPIPWHAISVALVLEVDVRFLVVI